MKIQYPRIIAWLLRGEIDRYITERGHIVLEGYSNNKTGRMIDAAWDKHLTIVCQITDSELF